MKRVQFFLALFSTLFIFSPLFGKGALQGEVKQLYKAYQHFYYTAYAVDNNQNSQISLDNKEEKKVSLQGEVRKLYNVYRNYYNMTYSLNDNNITQVGSRESRGSFLNKPGQRMKKIKIVLLRASRKIVAIQTKLDEIIAKIILNERKLMKRISKSYKSSLVRRNINYFKRIEQLRLRIAQIQLDTAKKIFRIEKNGHNTVVSDTNKQLNIIKRNPSAYWLWRRRQLLTSSELRGTLSAREVRRLYKKR